MLLFQDKSVVEICFECGFNNVTYFNKVFKDILKKTPSEFRKIEKNPSTSFSEAGNRSIKSINSNLSS
mgnify:CR=1 FL=1